MSEQPTTPPAGPPQEDFGDDGLVVRKSGFARWLWLAGALLVVLWGAWWMTHPSALPTPDRAITGSTPVKTPVYVGILGPAEGGNRTLHITDVTVPVLDSTGDATATAYVCHHGSISVTRDPATFCESVEDAQGATLRLGDGDQLLIKVESNVDGAVRIGPALVTYREGLQFATQRTGPSVEITVLPR
jgi:hypothetical protein